VEIVSGIIALLKAIPILDNWFKGLVMAYSKYRMEKFDKDFSRGMADLIKHHDQRTLEEVLGMNPGPSDDQSDVVTRPHRPRTP
jgi:hypothetical protein